MSKTIFIYLLILLTLFCGCEQNEIIIPDSKDTKLIINWEREIGHDNYKDNARLYLFSSEQDYINPIGKTNLSRSLANIYPPAGGGITVVRSATFYNLEPQMYWVKIFNAYKDEGLIEFNTDSASVLQFNKSTNTNVTIRTKRILARSCTIRKIEIYDKWLNLNNGDQVTAKFTESIYDRWRDKDVQNITISNSPIIIYEPTNAVIPAYGSGFNHYIDINKVGSSSTKIFKIDIFELLNSNLHFGNEYIKLNNQNEIEYKLFVTWDLR